MCNVHFFLNLFSFFALHVVINRIKEYNEIWTDLRKCSYVWRKILVPGHCVFDLGVSEAIYSSISNTVILEKPSPVIFMRARKNPTELNGMKRAHILDGAAMCDVLSLLERRVCYHFDFNILFQPYKYLKYDFFFVFFLLVLLLLLAWWFWYLVFKS